MSPESDLPLAFIDIETTSLCPIRGSIVQCTVQILQPLRARPWRRAHYGSLGRMTWYLHPEQGALVEDGAIKANGYNSEAWDAVGTHGHHEFALDLARMTDNCRLVGQNVAFDWSFLVQLFHRYGVTFKGHYRKLDVGSAWWPSTTLQLGVQSMSQHRLGVALGVPNSAPHRSYGDVSQMIDIYFELMQRQRLVAPAAWLVNHACKLWGRLALWLALQGRP